MINNNQYIRFFTLNTFAALLFLCTGTAAISAQQIQRMEPANWWTGMRYNEIEVLVYGNNIAHLQVKVVYPGIQLKGLRSVPNPNYLFITINIGPAAKPGTLLFEFYDGNQQRFTHPFELWQRESMRAEVRGFNSSDVIYMITPDRFANGNPANDDLPGMLEKADRTKKGGRHGGDISGIRNSLGYIRDLGFTSLWINPLLENNMKAYSYHGYAITDLYKTDPRFGSNEEYRLLVSEARAKGMKVIMDMVANHIGLEHWWMKDLPTEDWINQWPEFTRSNHKKTVILDPYAAAVDKEAFVKGWFDTTMPDLNQQNPLLARYLIQNTLWWIEYAGISGIRMDTYPYPDMNFMSEWAKTVMDEYPNFNIVGEEWFYFPTVTSYWQSGKDNPNHYESHLKTVMDFPLHDALVKSLNQSNSWTSSWTEVYQSLSQDYLYPDPQHVMVFPDNHDMSRIFTLLKEDFDAWKLAMTFLLTTRGIPCIYYGTEILMTNPGSDDHGIIRSDFPGGWEQDVVNAFSGKGLQPQQKEATAFLQKLLQWRQRATGIHTGKLLHFAPDNNDVYVYFRFDDQRKIMVLLNKNKAKVQLPLAKYAEGLGSASSVMDILTGQKVVLKDFLDVPARTPMIIELDIP